MSEQAVKPLREHAELRYQRELATLVKADTFPKPPNWQLSPRMVEIFITGSGNQTFKDEAGEPLKISPKYLGDRALVQTAIATLLSDRALMLVGEPGTAKSWLSEHIAAAVCNDSGLVVQGTAATTEEQIKYSWNYALLLAEGPSLKALVPSPVYRAMERGHLSRFEEITRCPSEVQDTLLSLLSEKEIAIPELGHSLGAQRGFNLIATANTRDRGVNDMSSALKRRFNFVTLPVVSDLETEMAIVSQRSADLMREFSVQAQIPRDLLNLLVTAFRELRQGQTLDGRAKVRQPGTVLSTAEAISVLFNGAIMAGYFGNGQLNAAELLRSMAGAVSKEDAKDLGALEEYLDTVARHRSGAWKEFYQARKVL